MTFLQNVPIYRVCQVCVLLDTKRTSCRHNQIYFLMILTTPSNKVGPLQYLTGDFALPKIHLVSEDSLLYNCSLQGEKKQHIWYFWTANRVSTIYHILSVHISDLIGQCFEAYFSAVNCYRIDKQRQKKT